MVLYRCMKSLRNGAHNLLNNTPVQSEMYREFYHDIAYIDNGGRHIIICILHLFCLNVSGILSRHCLYRQWRASCYNLYFTFVLSMLIVICRTVPATLYLTFILSARIMIYCTVCSFYIMFDLRSFCSMRIVICRTVPSAMYVFYLCFVYIID